MFEQRLTWYGSRLRPVQRGRHIPFSVPQLQSPDVNKLLEDGADSESLDLSIQMYSVLK